MSEAIKEIMATAIGHATDYDGNPLDGHFHVKELHEYADAALSALSSAGYVVVPATPTAPMLDAAADAAYENDGFQNIYAAMLAAFTEQATVTGGGE